MDERRYTPRAHLDEGGDRYTNRAALLSSGQEHCDRINFHVLVSLMPGSPSSPTSRAQAPPGRERRTGGGAAMGEARRSGDLRSQAAAGVLDLGHPHSSPEEQPLEHTTYRLTVPFSGIPFLSAHVSFFLFLRPHSQHMEVPRLAVQSEL